MQLVVDNETYEQIGPVFTEEIVRNIARALLTEGFDLDPQNPSERYLGLIENICFNIFVQMEGPNRVRVGAVDYFAHLTFSTDKRNPQQAIMADNRTILHGEALTTDLIHDALAQI